MDSLFKQTLGEGTLSLGHTNPQGGWQLAAASTATEWRVGTGHSLEGFQGVCFHGAEERHDH